MIRATYAANSRGCAVGLSRQRGGDRRRARRAILCRCLARTAMRSIVEPVDILMKVETHNHPTAISPFPGAATGSGGEIRDEGATGIGAKPKAGLTGFSVSNLRIPGMLQPWEAQDCGKTGADRLGARHHDRAPLGRGRIQQRVRPRRTPAGIFACSNSAARARRHRAGRSVTRGYHKPIMLAGGLGNVRRDHVEKKEVVVGAPLDRARRTVDADRPRRRRGIVGRQRTELLGFGFCLGAARQSPKSSGARRRSSIAAGRMGVESDPLDPRCGRRRTIECAARGDRAQPSRRPDRFAQDSERRIRTVADGDLVQRGAGALRAGAAYREASSDSRPCASASAVRSRWSVRSRGDGRLRVIDPLRRARPSTCRSRCCSAAAAHDPRRFEACRKGALRYRPPGPASPNRSIVCCVCRRSPISRF